MDITGNAATNNAVGKCPLRCKLLHKNCHWNNDVMQETSRTGQHVKYRYNQKYSSDPLKSQYKDLFYQDLIYPGTSSYNDISDAQRGQIRFPVNQEVLSPYHEIKYELCYRCTNYYYNTFPTDARSADDSNVYRDAGRTAAATLG